MKRCIHKGSCLGSDASGLPCPISQSLRSLFVKAITVGQDAWPSHIDGKSELMANIQKIPHSVISLKLIKTDGISPTDGKSELMANTQRIPHSVKSQNLSKLMAYHLLIADQNWWPISKIPTLTKTPKRCRKVRYIDHHLNHCLIWSGSGAKVADIGFQSSHVHLPNMVSK